MKDCTYRYGMSPEESRANYEAALLQKPEPITGSSARESLLLEKYTVKKLHWVSVTGGLKVRRVSDGVMAKGNFKIELDAVGTTRDWINLQNNVSLHPQHSGWIRASGSVTGTDADKTWSALGQWGQVNSLLRGMLMTDHEGTDWEVIAVADTLESSCYVVDMRTA